MKRLLLVLAVALWALPLSAKSVGQGTIPVKIDNDRLLFDGFALSFQRTLRIPNDGKEYPLPPGLGNFPIYRVEDYAKKLPEAWVKEGGVFIPMYQREAMWISFGGEAWRPRAVKIGIGKINVLTGEAWNPDLKFGESQDYLVAPTPQPWIDGIKSGKNSIRQFVTMPLGMGYTVEGQITGKETAGGLQILVTNPVKGKFKKPAADNKQRLGMGGIMAQSMAESREEGMEMGVGAGGKMTQKIYSDPHGAQTWDTKSFAVVMVHIVNSEMFEKITGKKPPESPITKKEYEQLGYPWFGLYDEKMGDIKTREKLGKIKPVPTKDSPIKVKKVIKYDMPK